MRSLVFIIGESVIFMLCSFFDCLLCRVHTCVCIYIYIYVPCFSIKIQNTDILCEMKKENQTNLFVLLVNTIASKRQKSFKDMSFLHKFYKSVDAKLLLFMYNYRDVFRQLSLKK